MLLLMSRAARLFDQVLANPRHALPFRDFITLIEGFGFVHQRTRGSHQAFVHPACPRPLILQPDGKEAKRYQIRQFLDMVSAFGLRLEE